MTHNIELNNSIILKSSLILLFITICIIGEAQNEAFSGKYVGKAQYKPQITYKLYTLEFFDDNTFIAIKRHEELCYYSEDTSTGKWNINNDTISFYDIEQEHHVKKGKFNHLPKNTIQVVSKCIKRKTQKPKEIFIISLDSNYNIQKIKPLKLEYLNDKSDFIKVTDYYFNNSNKPTPFDNLDDIYAESFVDSSEKDLLLTFQIPKNAYQLILFQTKEYDNIEKYHIEQGINLVDFDNHNLFVISNCMMSYTNEFISPLTKFQLKGRKKLKSLKPLSIYNEGKKVLKLQKQ